MGVEGVATEAADGRSVAAVRQESKEAPRPGRGRAGATKRRREAVSPSRCSSEESQTSTNTRLRRMDSKQSMTNDAMDEFSAAVRWTPFQGSYNNADPNKPLSPNEDGPSNPVGQVKERGKRKITTPRSKLSNFSPSEDVFLVKSWLEVSCDATTNTGQKKNRVWDRVLIQYNSKRGFYPERSVRSLQSRWEIIKAKVGKFSSYMANVLHTNPSGTSDADKTSKAAATFADIEGVSFSFMHCWDIMKDEPKWMDTRYLKGTRPSKVEAYADHILDESNIVEQSPGLFAPTLSAGKRPPGQDPTKAAHKKSCSAFTSSTASEFAANMQVLTLDKHSQRGKENDQSASRHEQPNVMERILRLKQQKLRLQREKMEFDQKMKQEAEEERILSIDLETCSPMLRIYYQARQEEILERIQAQQEEILERIQARRSRDL